MTILWQKLMADPKTTLTGLITGLAVIIAYFGFDVSPKVQTAIVTLGVFILSIVSRDTKTPIPPEREPSPGE